MNAVAPKTSPVIPFNFLCDILPIIKITQKFKINPNKIPHKGKTKGKGTNQINIATSQFFVETFSIILPVFEKVETVSYTHLTLPTKRKCRSRWSPYH